MKIKDYLRQASRRRRALLYVVLVGLVVKDVLKDILCPMWRLREFVQMHTPPR